MFTKLKRQFDESTERQWGLGGWLTVEVWIVFAELSYLLRC
jgi:hypothetical protein